MANAILDNILQSIKALLGLQEAVTDFDTELIMYINSAFMHLEQLGLISDGGTGFNITSETNWTDFRLDCDKFQSLRVFVFLKTKSIFDPPASGVAVQAIASQLDELAFRMVVQLKDQEVAETQI